MININNLYKKCCLFIKATEQNPPSTQPTLIQDYSPFPSDKQKELLTNPNQDEIDQSIKNKISKQTLLEALTTKPENWYPIIDNLIEANVLSPNIPISNQLIKVLRFIGTYFQMNKKVVFDLKAGDQVLNHFLLSHLHDQAKSAIWAYKIRRIGYFESPIINHMDSTDNKYNPLQSAFESVKKLYTNAVFDFDYEADVDIHYTDGFIKDYNEDQLGEEKVWVITI